MKKPTFVERIFLRSILAIVHSARARLLPLFSQFLENFWLYTIHLIAMVLFDWHVQRLTGFNLKMSAK